MKVPAKVITILSLISLPVPELLGQPVWLAGTPSVVSTGQVSITINYGLRQLGTVYIIVFNYDNNTVLTSSYVRTRAASKPAGAVVATAVRTLKRGEAGMVLQTTLNVENPGQIHTIYIVAADTRGVLQLTPVRLTATTLPCYQANAGTGGDECDRNFQLNAVPGPGTGTWTRISGPGNATFSPNNHTANAIVTVSVFGSYTFRWTEIIGPCNSSSDIIVNFFQPPQANAGSGGNECDLDFVLNAVPGNGTGTWTMTEGTGTAVFVPNASDPGATVRVSEYGTKVFTWIETAGQCSDSSGITVNFYRSPVADAGSGGTNCGLEIYLNAVPSIGTGTWTRVSGPGNVSFSPDANTPTAKATASVYGTYVLRWTEVNGPCMSSESITIDFGEFISANAGNGGDECDKDFRFSALPGTGTGTWSKVGGPGAVTFSPDAHQYNALVTVSEYGAFDFAWTEVNFNCSSTDVIRVVFHNAPPVNAGLDQIVCKGSSARLQAAGTGSFLWTPAAPLNNPAISDPVATPLVTTNFNVRLTDQWGCVNTDQVRVEVREKPVSNAGADQLLDYTFETLLEATELNPYETGVWTVLTGTGDFEDMNKNNSKVTGLSVGENKLVWSVTNGVCAISSDTLTIKINDLHLPTLITPNNDGKNDIFVIKGIGAMGKTVLKVFNRWGGLVYTDSDYSNDWDGKDSEGNPLPEDTYYYILKPEQRKRINGYIVIRR